MTKTLTDKTGYLITESNANTLAYISGFELKTLKANLDWCMVYNEHGFPRWQIVPRSVVIRSTEFKLDVDTYE
jgi:hypothetical protein